VRLKSGGPSMLIVSVNRSFDPAAQSWAECVWNEDDTIFRRRFPIDALEEVDSFQFCMGATRQGLD